MGLRGAHAKQPQRNVAKAAPSAWKRKRSRVHRVIAFLESMPITKGILAGKKMKLLPGQRRFIEAVYGRVAADGRRQIRIAIKSEPRGNGKTGLLAGLALAHLLGPECEPRGEVYSAAYNKLQAALIFAEMKAIIEAIPEFDVRCNIQRYGKVIEVLEGDGAGSIYESLSADDKRAHGLSPSFWVFDEFAQSPNSDLLDNLRTAMGKRSESLGVIISTQAPNDQHPLSQMIDDAALGEDPSVYLQLAAAPIDGDIFDEKTWFDCNEALGKFLDLNEFRSQAEQAKRLPSFRAKFENLRLNKRIDANVQFLTDADWMACADPLDMPALAGKPCYAGLDLSHHDGHERAGAVLAIQRRRAAVLLVARGRLARSRSQGRRTLSHLARCGIAGNDAGPGDQFQGDHSPAGRDQHRIRSARRRLRSRLYQNLQRAMRRAGRELRSRNLARATSAWRPRCRLLEAAVLDSVSIMAAIRFCDGKLATSRSKWTRPATGRPKEAAIGHIDGVISLADGMGVAAQSGSGNRR